MGGVGYEILGRVERSKELGKTETDKRFFESDKQRILKFLKKDTLAYRIVESAKSSVGLSEKQRWSVAYSLMGSKEFRKRVALSVRVYKEARAERAAKKAAEKAAKKAQKQSKPLSRFQQLGFPDFNLIKR